LKCTLEYLQHQEKWMKTEKQAPWSAMEIIEVYQLLFELLDDKQQLPMNIPLPFESYICIARSEVVAPGYPAYGHIIGKGALVAEGGCPNGHVLCKNCADKLSFCPEPNCGASIAYQEMPFGCPAYPGDENHCAYFNKACEVEGCDGGMWPRKQPEEVTSPSQSKDEAPKNAEPANAEEVMAELLEPAAKKGSAGGKRNRHRKQTSLKRHTLTRSQTKRLELPRK
jgi:hypothetical protein